MGGKRGGKNWEARHFSRKVFLRWRSGFHCDSLERGPSRYTELKLPSSFANIANWGAVVPRTLGCHAEEFNRRERERGMERERRASQPLLQTTPGSPEFPPSPQGRPRARRRENEPGTVPGEAEWSRAAKSTRSAPTVSKKVREAEAAMEPVGARAKGALKAAKGRVGSGVRRRWLGVDADGPVQRPRSSSALPHLAELSLASAPSLLAPSLQRGPRSSPRGCLAGLLSPPAGR